MFYVYLFYDPRNNAPIYVGKGLNGSYRHRDHFHHNLGNVWLFRKIGRIKAAGLEPLIAVDGFYEHEAEALSRECELIALHGRADRGLGTLCNLTDGGDGASGAIRTEANRDGMRQRWRDGIGQKVMEGLQSAWADPERRAQRIASMKAALAAPEVRERRSRSMSRTLTPELRAIIREKAMRAMSTPECRAKKSAATSRNWSNPEYRERIRAAVTATKNKWWIFVGGTKFGSAASAAAFLCVSRATVLNRCRRGIYPRILKSESHASG